ncbi:MAG: hypothetical protein GFH27_549293n224 [Chloroflexi bacterium AL-W]|nr:hypothetical protein [Chloroflexi bacterium AL-N1]NOK67661.1 hypothetical protein [Chloroflexi bacterium AL-N10]NOK75569.1 hypothetical protein [Chloroflexi bacterium AL-N5]NOK82357.1 hypothetical protein [Chloroflexi bacterium AL-W]NOK90202.1 hypothetical protein [Chloroflexi bacterium AL-N15]
MLNILQAFFQFLMVAWDVIRQVLAFDFSRIQELSQSEAGTNILIILSVLVTFFAGVSEGIGTQSVALFISRISRRRFYINIGLSGVLFVIGAVDWVITIWLVLRYFLDIPATFVEVACVVGLGYLPLLLAIFILVPYFGPAIGIGLHIWSLLTVLVMMHIEFGVTASEALLCVGVGWLIVQISRRFLNQPLVTINRWLWRITTGVSARVGPDDIPPILTGYVGNQLENTSGK